MLRQIIVENLSYTYESELILSDFSLALKEGEFVGLVGNNGSGKTTLIRLLAGIKKPTQGRIANDFRNIGYLSQLNVEKKNAFTASVEEVISLALKTRPFSFLTRNDKTKVKAALEEFGLKPFKDNRIDELSGGQQQKVRLAKILLEEPDLLLLDEPFTGIDAPTVLEIKEILKKLHENGKTIIMVSHNREDFINGVRFVELSRGGGR